LLIPLGRRVYLVRKVRRIEFRNKIEPYELTVKNFARDERHAWAAKVAEQLKPILKPRDTAVFIAGREYYYDLMSAIARIGCRVETPLAGLSFGRRLQVLKELNDEEQLGHIVQAFYTSIRDLYVSQDRGRLLAECSGRMEWPNRGVYFIIEEQVEAKWRGRSLGMPRITRVGTHAVSLGSKTTLWDRLSTHRGTSVGGGNHRSSIFRLHVGRALLNLQSNMDRVDSWGVGQTIPRDAKTNEGALEQEVSKTLGAMRVLWLDVGDAAGASSDRAYIERNAIGPLSRHNVSSGAVSDGWLGNYSTEYRIAVSGLWNLNHLFLKPDAAFLRVLQHYIDVTLARAPPRQTSVAPPDWYANLAKKSAATQLSFLADGKE
jgi:hypothetical protein